MRAVVEGRLEVQGSFTSHIDLCLGCRACESACPSGVPYGHLLEAARADIARARPKGERLRGLLLRLALNHLLTRPSFLGAALTLVRWFRDSGFARMIYDSGAVGARSRFALALLLSSRPSLKIEHSRPRAGSLPRSKGDREPSLRPSVTTLKGCVMEGLFKHINRATERVLARSGCQVVDTPGQVCCGALHSHAGEIETARALARRNIEAFSRTDCEFIAVNAAGCGAAMKEYGSLLSNDPEFGDRAVQFSSRVRDISELLEGFGISPPSGLREIRVAYDAPCHLLHAQKISSAPVELMSRISGVELVPLRGSETCCGGAGIYNLQHFEMSRDILKEKIESIRASGADAVASANPGCIMQIGAGLMLAGEQLGVAHPVELLDAAYEAG
jgi:glycolate oxidase iron-sulfur subunit